jgi:hypothetical protein
MMINGSSSSPGGRVTFLAQAHDEAWCTGALCVSEQMGHSSISDCFHVMNSKVFFISFLL